METQDAKTRLENAHYDFERTERNKFSTYLNNDHRKATNFADVISGIVNVILELCITALVIWAIVLLCRGEKEQMLPAVIGAILLAVFRKSICRATRNAPEKKRKEMEKQCNDSIAADKLACDQNIQSKKEQMARATEQALQDYKNEVKAYSQQVIGSERIKPMTKHAVLVFQQNISKADKSPSVKYIEAVLDYTVTREKICFMDAYGREKPQLSYDFTVEHAPVLKNDAQCEGLAQALAKQVVFEMKSLYPSDTMAIGMKHTDMIVALRYRDDNENYGKNEKFV